jgi:hypothetical protein
MTTEAKRLRITRPQARATIGNSACWRAAGLAAFGLGCSLGPEPATFALTLRFVSDPGEALAGVSVSHGAGGSQLSDAGGRVTTRVQGREGDTAAFVVRCPDGYRSPDEPVGIVLRRFVDPHAVPEQEVTCLPLSRRVVVAVRAPGGAELPVLAGGVEVARTDALGVAHVIWDLPVGESLELTLDTSAQPELQPRSPRQSFGELSSDDVLVFEQRFERRRSRPPSRSPIERIF